MSDHEEIFLPPKCCAQLQKQIKDLEANLKSQCDGNIELGRQVAMLESQREWVSVRERLPRIIRNGVSDWVIVTCNNSRSDIHGCQGRINLGIWDIRLGKELYVSEHVTHWQSLPAPPETDK